MRSAPYAKAALFAAAGTVGNSGPFIPGDAPPRRRAPNPPARELSPDDKAALARAEEKRQRKAMKRLAAAPQKE